jgi:hypothetical protein
MIGVSETRARSVTAALVFEAENLRREQAGV